MWQIFKKNVQNKKALEKLSNEIKSEPLNFSTLFANLNKRNEINTLYNELCVKAHPDRFIGDEEKIACSEKLFKRVQESKADYQKLLILKDEVNKLYEL